jgi:hypothetical protein
MAAIPTENSTNTNVRILRGDVTAHLLIETHTSRQMLAKANVQNSSTISRLCQPIQAPGSIGFQKGHDVATRQPHDEVNAPTITAGFSARIGT